MCFLLRTEAGSNRFIKIVPRWVRCLDQLVLSSSVPGFYLLFPCYCSLDIWCFFKIDQLCDVVFGGKAVGEMVVPMLCHAALQVIGHADIKGYIGLIGHDIDVVTHRIPQPPSFVPAGDRTDCHVASLLAMTKIIVSASVETSANQPAIGAAPAGSGPHVLVLLLLRGGRRPTWQSVPPR